MIRIEAVNGDEIGIRLSGHAGYAPAGSDIVCSACTILAYVIAHGVMAMAEEGLIVDDPLVRMDDGDIEILCWPTEDGRPLMEAIMGPVMATYVLLARSYPDYVQLI